MDEESYQELLRQLEGDSHAGVRWEQWLPIDDTYTLKYFGIDSAFTFSSYRNHAQQCSYSNNDNTTAVLSLSCLQTAILERCLFTRSNNHMHTYKYWNSFTYIIFSVPSHEGTHTTATLHYFIGTHFHGRDVT
jgi:hypothetical protein